MRKFLALCSFLCGVIFAGGAVAYDCVTYYSMGGVAKSEIYLYFGEDKDTAPASGECDASNGKGFDDVKTYLKGIWDSGNVAGFYVLGSASRTGTADYNAKLSLKRVKYVIGNILPDYSSLDLDYFFAGESKAAAFDVPDGTTDPDDRFAMIIVIWKQHTCTTETISLLDQIRKIGKDVQECKEVIEYCKDGTGSKDVLFEDKLNKLHDCASKLKLQNVIGFDNWYKVDQAYSKMIALLGGISVWKNTEGRFNTARLLSDSIAAVVLGTTSGVITSTLVKKNQIKKGFESLQCVIGGQHVADYGDEFVVGATAGAYSR